MIDREASEARKTAAAAMSSRATNRLSGAELVTSSKTASQLFPVARAWSSMTETIRGPSTAPGEDLRAKAEPGFAGAAKARAQAHVVGLALVYALLDCCGTIGREHLKAARAVWPYSGQSAQLDLRRLARGPDR